MLFLHIFTSLDGYIEDRNGSIEWMAESPEFDRYILERLGSIDSMIFGRLAHELLSKYWPDSDRPEARLMNELPKYVLTRSGKCATWNNSHAIDAEGVAVLKRKAKGDIALFAGATAARTLMDRGLVDSIQLLVNPVLLGGGKALFASDPAQRHDLRLTETRELGSGMVKLEYDIAKPATD
jgi:dihydrofolate reductase